MLSLKTTQRIARLERDNKLMKKRIDYNELKIIQLRSEIEYLTKRNETLEAIENSLPQRIETYKSKKAPMSVIKELEFWETMLKEEKEKILKRCENEKI